MLQCLLANWIRHLVQHCIAYRGVRNVIKALPTDGRQCLVLGAKNVCCTRLNVQLVQLELRDVLLNHWLQDEQLVGLLVVPTN